MKLFQNKITTLILYAMCGIACAIPAIFNEFWFLGWISYIPVLLNEMQNEDDSPKPYRRAFFRGLSFFFPYGLTTFYWLWELYPLDFAGFTPISALFVILLGWIGLPLMQGIVSAFSLVVLQILKKKNLPYGLWPITSAFVWIVFEWAHTLTWAGVPWGKLAVGQVGMLYNIQSASLLGSYFVSFIMICVAGYIALAIMRFKTKETLGKGTVALICAIVIFSSNFLYGILAIYQELEYLDTISVGIVQGNVATVDKWDNDQLGTLSEHKQLAGAASKEGADLIVFAETAFPYIINKDEFLTDYLTTMAKDVKASMVIGCLHVDDSSSLYNSTRYISPNGGFLDVVYNKRRPVPFGEYVPMSNVIKAILPVLNNINLLKMEVTAGNSSSVFDTEFGKIGSLICFDSIYENLTLETVRDGAELLVISTNDSWFRDSAAVYQHNAHAILRSVETGRYTVRAANTGISTIITDKGEVVKALDPLVQGILVGDAKFTNRNTAYTMVGNVIILCAFSWILILTIWLSIKQKRGSKLSCAQRAANKSLKKKK